MNLVKQGIPLSAISMLILSTSALAESRSIAMGGTGVASANFMSASIHNPALAASGESEHHFGMILPSATASVHDGEGILDKLDTYFDAEDVWRDNPADSNAREAWKQALRDLNNGDVTAEVSAAMIFAIPNKYVNTNFFVATHATALATADIDDNDFDNTSPDDEVESTATGLIGGTLDFGLTLAKTVELWGQDMSFGASPKVQQIYTTYFRERLTEDDIDDADFFDDLESKTTFNLDLGASWQIQDHWNVAVSAKNLISHSLDTNMQLGERATFEVKPEYRIGTAYSRSWYTLAADVDLNSRSYFKQQDYKTQYAKLGAEADLWKWAQLRAGYMHSMTSYTEDVFTAGIGFRPYGVFGFDISGQFGKDDNYGVSAQLTLVI